MHTVVVTREMNFPANTVWNLLDDFAGTWVYHPVVRHSEAVNGVKRGLGAARRCDLYDGTSVQEKITRYNPQEMRYHVEVFDHGPFPTTHMDVTIEVVQTAPQKSLVRYTCRFKVKYGPMGWLMGKAAMGPKMRQMLGKVLEGVETHLDTGRVVGQGGTVEPSRAAA